jgi:hypothetical protein
VLIEAPGAEIDHAVSVTQSAMKRASELVLAGFPLRTEAQITRYPERFAEKRGTTMWKWITESLDCEK